MESLLPVLEGLLDGSDESNVFVNCDAEGKNILLGLAVVELADTKLDV